MALVCFHCLATWESEELGMAGLEPLWKPGFLFSAGKLILFAVLKDKQSKNESIQVCACGFDI